MEIISWLNYVLYLEPPIHNRTKPKHIIGNQPPCILINVQHRQSFHLTPERLGRPFLVHGLICYHLVCKPTGMWYGPPFLEVDWSIPDFLLIIVKCSLPCVSIDSFDAEISWTHPVLVHHFHLLALPLFIPWWNQLHVGKQVMFEMHRVVFNALHVLIPLIILIDVNVRCIFDIPRPRVSMVLVLD